MFGYLQRICKDLGSIEACDKNSLSSKLCCLIFKLAFGNRSFWNRPQANAYDTNFFAYRIEVALKISKKWMIERLGY